MNPVVTELAVPVIPKPMPVVMDQVSTERPHGSRSYPQIPVKRGGRVLRRSERQGIAPLVVNTTRHVDVANHAL